MNSFDFIQTNSLGFYIPGNSFFHQRHPSIRIIIIFLLLIAITFCNSIIGISSILLLFTALFLSCKIPLQPIWTTLKNSLFFILLIAVVQLLFYRPPPQSTVILKWEFIHLYDTALKEAATMVLRILTLITGIIFANSTLSSLEIQQGLEMILRPLQKLKVDTNQIILTVQIMLRFLPILAMRMELIAKSQASRGAEWDSPKGGLIKRLRLFFPFLIPLFISSLQQAEKTTEAIISRAYGLSRIRTHFYRYTLKASDLALLAFTLIAAYLVLFPPVSIF